MRCADDAVPRARSRIPCPPRELRRSAEAARRTKARRPRETERGRRAGSRRRRGRARALRRCAPAGRSPNAPDPRRREAAATPAAEGAAPIPPARPTPTMRTPREERRGRRGTRERQPRIAPAEREEAERREEDDRRVPEQPLVREHRQPEEPRKEGIRERLPAYPPPNLPKRGESKRDQRRRIPESDKNKGHGGLRRSGRRDDAVRCAVRRASRRAARSSRPRPRVDVDGEARRQLPPPDRFRRNLSSFFSSSSSSEQCARDERRHREDEQGLRENREARGDAEDDLPAPRGRSFAQLDDAKNRKRDAQRLKRLPVVAGRVPQSGVARTDPLPRPRPSRASRREELWSAPSPRRRRRGMRSAAERKRAPREPKVPPREGCASQSRVGPRRATAPCRSAKRRRPPAGAERRRSPVRRRSRKSAQRQRRPRASPCRRG